MKLGLLEQLAAIVCTICLFTALPSQAMEKTKDEHISCAVSQELTDTVVERIYNTFSQKIEEIFTEQPKTFNEALVRLKCIAKLLEKSKITSPNTGEDFKITQNTCEITTIDLPHHLLHPIFKNWFDKAYNKILLEHPKAVEATQTIFKRLSENVSPNTLDNYHRATTSLPKILSEYIQDKFIDMHGWPLDIKPSITFDDTGVKHILFIHDNYFVEGFKDGLVHKTLLHNNDAKNIADPSAWISRSSTLINNDLARGILLELGLTEEMDGNVKPLKGFNDKEEASTVLPHLWQKPTFQEALEKRAFENKQKKQKPEKRCLIS